MAVVVRSLAMTYYAGHHLEAHAHPWGQLVYAASGVMRVTLQNTFWVVPPTRAIWAPPDVHHEIDARGDYSMRTIYIAPEFSNGLPTAGGALHVTPLLRELLLRIVTIGMLDDAQHGALIAVLLDELAQAQTSPISLAFPRDRRARAVAERLRADPTTELDLATIAAGAGASARTIQRLFRDETCLRFTQWRRRLRLLNALQLLNDGASVTVAGVEAGYASTSAFVAAFRAEMGFTPAKCRAQPGVPATP